ncbi:MAG: hypothetical protein ACK5WZ_05840 [Pseudobdellovibrionaceae bacterium]
MSWLKKLLLVVYVLGVIAISIQLTAKSEFEFAQEAQKIIPSFKKVSEPINSAHFLLTSFSF